MPKKIKLDIKGLKVQSFVTSMEEDLQKKVVGAINTITCYTCYTCPYNTCNSNCNTCDGTGKPICVC
jgi:hypothetical protein